MTYSTPWTGPASANTRASCSSDVSLNDQLTEPDITVIQLKWSSSIYHMLLDRDLQGDVGDYSCQLFPLTEF